MKKQGAFTFTILLLTFILLTTSYSQEDFYKEKFKLIDSLQTYGFTKSALEEIDAVYLKASRDNDYPKMCFALYLRVISLANISENYPEDIIKILNDELINAPAPYRNILHSLLASSYEYYFQSNKYKILGRSKIIGVEQKDINFWDASKFVEVIIDNYKKSLEDESLLQSVKVEEYKEMLTSYSQDKIPEGRKFRPTLFDLLAHRAIDFFAATETDVTQPAEQFAFNSPDYFLPAEDFVKIEIKTTDPFSYRYYAIVLLQKLIQFHLNDINPEALIDVDLKRLEFVHKYSSIPAKEQLILEAYQYLTKRYSGNEFSALINYKIAELYVTSATLYKPLISDEHKWDLRTALSYCKKAIDDFPSSEGAKLCIALQNKLESYFLTLNTQSIVPANQPSVVFIKYRNLGKTYLKVFKAPIKSLETITKELEADESLSSYDERTRALIKALYKFPVAYDTTIDLPDDRDYQPHSTEFVLPPLDFGEYIIIASSTNDFNFNDNIYAISALTVSNIAYVYRDNDKNENQFFFHDRYNGTPLSNINVEVFIERYDENKFGYIYEKYATLNTDKNGFLQFKLPKEEYSYSRYYLVATNNNDVLNTRYIGSSIKYFTNNNFYDYSQSIHKTYDKQQTEQIFYFTDRAIYRPGQTVNFKGLLISSLEDEHKIVTNHQLKVNLYDANGQEVSTLTLQTNNYGSFAGSFVLPANKTGKMRIASPEITGAIYFNVEEYKRPKFEVTIGEIQGTYKLEQNVKINGMANTYSGVKIDNATVKYRITRQSYIPYKFYWYFYPKVGSTVEILNGVTRTKPDGSFEIEFPALPDPTIPKSSNPYYNFTINIDVTDINGETISASKSVSIGYSALKLGINIPDYVDKFGKKDFLISATNYSMQKQPAKVTLTIWKIKTPETPLVDRPWKPTKYIYSQTDMDIAQIGEVPDKLLYTKSQFKKLLPHYPYGNEDDYTKWEPEFKVLEKNFDTNVDSVLSLNLDQWNQGFYFVEMTAEDNFGEKAEFKNYFTVFDKFSSTPVYNLHSYIIPIKSKYEPGETAEILIGSALKNFTLYYDVEVKNDLTKSGFVKLDNSQTRLEIPVTQNEIGNFAFHLVGTNLNQLMLFSNNFSVPYTDKMLNISFETFRNKLLPGSEEEWKLKIQGKGGEKVMAEMLATLYDASLDAFAPLQWYFDIYRYYNYKHAWTQNDFTESYSSEYYYLTKPLSYFYNIEYERLKWVSGGYYDYELDSKVMLKAKTEEEPTNGLTRKDGLSKKEAPTPEIQIRKDFSETAFFYPQLETDKEGNLAIRFKIPESLTKWKMMGFAHTQDLKYGFVSNELATQKDLMISLNAPRFFREGDEVYLSAKISNLTEKETNIITKLEVFDPITMQTLSNIISSEQEQTLPVNANSNSVVKWTLKIPDGYTVLAVRATARSNNFSDGEEITLPVLTNQMLVTETLPLPIREGQTKNFSFQKLLNNTSTTLRSYKFTIEFTSNPVWYAVLSLPYLIEYPYECSEQIFSRIYANSIGSQIVNSDSKIRNVFDTWLKYQPDAFLSKLEKNQDLKNILLEETPWVREATSETEQNRRVAVLFDIMKMKYELEAAINKLQDLQLSNGGFPWFKGMPDDWFITQHILTGFGKLRKMGIEDVTNNNSVKSIIVSAIKYVDSRIANDYNRLVELGRRNEIKLEDQHIWYIHIHYLYCRSFFKEIPISDETKEAYNYFISQAEKYWINMTQYSQAQTAIALHRLTNSGVPDMIVRAFSENALHSDEFGMYWNWNKNSYYWYEAPIETQALMIEVFDEVANDSKSVDELRIWLLKNKQTNRWNTTKATVDAVYALLLKGTNWLTTEQDINIKVGELNVNPKNIPDLKIEAGTGYFRTSWYGNDITSNMGNITVSKTSSGISWGAAYWQYFEQLDKIQQATTELKLTKKLFLETNTPTGPVISPIDENTQLKVGDKIKVVIEITTDRDLEYIHLKDMRASGLEPTNVISTYKWQGGIGYYENTRDAATNFFISYLPKGLYRFEYPLVVNMAGIFSNGITSIQCMYAPEFSAHSEGIKIKVTD
ncbi:MAG: alpha-2-macroglobulin family protein [Ignavibacteria bacterium]